MQPTVGEEAEEEEAELELELELELRQELRSRRPEMATRCGCARRTSSTCRTLRRATTGTSSLGASVVRVTLTLP